MNYEAGLIQEDANAISTETLRLRPHSRALAFEELLPILASPDTAQPLTWDKAKKVLSDGLNAYPLRGTIPLLLPLALHQYFTDRLEVPPTSFQNSFLQYFLLSSIKQSGEINASSEDLHYQRHLFRIQKQVSHCKGSVLDIGCDNPSLGASIFPSTASYVGLDPFCKESGQFRLVGVAEYLPFQNNSFQNVLFNTSLDHILDWRRAISEAHRVLAPGGLLYLSTLLWTDRAELISDAVHFHHFREYEILGGLAEFKIVSIEKYNYKGNSHRHGMYLTAQKRINLTPC